MSHSVCLRYPWLSRGRQGRPWLGERERAIEEGIDQKGVYGQRFGWHLVTRPGVDKD